MSRWSTALALSFAIGCAPSAMGPLSVRFLYKTVADPVDFPLLQACAAVVAVEASDARNSSTLGTRFFEKSPQSAHQVTSTSDASAWARAGVEEALRRARVQVGKSGAPVLQVVIENIVTEESVYRRAEYDGRVVLSATLRPTASEPPCWNERVEGVAENYGYAGSVENYQETLNHALDRAAIQLLSSSGFKSAACSCTPKTGI